MSSKRKKNTGSNPNAIRPQPAGAYSPKLPAVSQNHWLTFAVCLLLGLGVWAVFGQTRSLM